MSVSFGTADPVRGWSVRDEDRIATDRRMVAFTKRLACEVGAYGITVNCICGVRADLGSCDCSAAAAVEEAILFFAGRGSGHITGQTLNLGEQAGPTS